MPDFDEIEICVEDDEEANAQARESKSKRGKKKRKALPKNAAVDKVSITLDPKRNKMTNQVGGPSLLRNTQQGSFSLTPQVSESPAKQDASNSSIVTRNKPELTKICFVTNADRVQTRTFLTNEKWGCAL